MRINSIEDNVASMNGDDAFVLDCETMKITKLRY